MFSRSRHRYRAWALESWADRTSNLKTRFSSSAQEGSSSIRINAPQLVWRSERIEITIHAPAPWKQTHVFDAEITKIKSKAYHRASRRGDQWSSLCHYPPIQKMIHSVQSSNVVAGSYRRRSDWSGLMLEFVNRLTVDPIFLVASFLFYLLTKIRLSYLRAQHRFSHLQLLLLKISIRRLDDLLCESIYFIKEIRPTSSRCEAILCSAIYM